MMIGTSELEKCIHCNVDRINSLDCLCSSNTGHYFPSDNYKFSVQVEPPPPTFNDGFAEGYSQGWRECWDYVFQTYKKEEKK